VEWLGDVGRRELDDDALALARLVRSVAVLLGEREALGELVGARVGQGQVGKVRQGRVVLVGREVGLRVDLLQDGREEGLGCEVEVDERAGRTNLGEVRRGLELRGVDTEACQRIDLVEACQGNMAVSREPDETSWTTRQREHAPPRRAGGWTTSPRPTKGARPTGSCTGVRRRNVRRRRACQRSPGAWP